MSPAFHIDIHHHGSPIGYLNDLTLHQGYIIANVWFLDILLVITPHHGQVVGIIDLSYLRKMFPKIQAGDVLNGVCTMPDGNLLITGKNWPYFFHIEVNLRPNEPDQIHLTI
jgi:glutamine cyclotransferase